MGTMLQMTSPCIVEKKPDPDGVRAGEIQSSACPMNIPSIGTDPITQRFRRPTNASNPVAAKSAELGSGTAPVVADTPASVS